jgi:hypothetical protein
MFVPLCILVATTLLRLWRRRRGLLIALCCVLALATVPFLYDKSRMNHNISAAQVPWKDADARVPDNSLVVVRDSGPYLLHLNPYGINAPDLDGRVLYAVDRNAKTFDLLDRYPDRTPIMEITSNTALDDAIHHPDAVPPRIFLEPITVHAAPAVTFRVQVRNPGGAAATVASIQVGDQADQRVLEPESAGSTTYATEWTVVPSSDAAAVARGGIPVSGRGVISIYAGLGTDASNAVNGPQEREKFTFRVRDGEVQVLDPSRKTFITPDGGRNVQRDVAKLGTLHVTVTTP